MSLEPAPFAPPPASVYRVEFSPAVRGQRAAAGADRRFWGVAFVAFAALAGTLIWLGQVQDVFLLPMLVIGFAGASAQAWRIARMPREAAALSVDRHGLDLWSPTGAHLELPWAAVRAVRVGKLSIGVELADGVTADMAGVVGLDTRAGRAFARQLADPTGSPYYVDHIAGYDRAALTAAIERLSGGRARVTG